MSKNKTPSPKILARFEKILSLLQVWAPKIENEDNIAKWISPWVPLKIWAALKECWVWYSDWHWMLNRYSYFKERYEDFKEIRRWRLMDWAEANLLDAIEGRLNIEDKDMARLSFDVATKLIKEYNPANKLEVDMNFSNLSEEDILEKINELNFLIKWDENNKTD